MSRTEKTGISRKESRKLYFNKFNFKIKKKKPSELLKCEGDRAYFTDLLSHKLLHRQIIF